MIENIAVEQTSFARWHRDDAINLTPICLNLHTNRVQMKELLCGTVYECAVVGASVDDIVDMMIGIKQVGKWFVISQDPQVWTKLTVKLEKEGNN